MVVPLKDGNQYLGDIEIRVGADDSIEASTKQIFDLISPRLDPAALAPLRPLAEPGVFAPLERFAVLGMPVTLDRRTLELAIAVPVSARSRQSIGLSDLDREVYGDFATPEAFTAYLNLRTSTDYVHVGPDQGFGEAQVFMDGASRIGRFVVEAEGAFDSGDGRFQRNGTRLVWDDVERLNRWTAGDLLAQNRGFQGAPDLAGFSVERAYGLLDPQRNTAPRGGQTFSLEQASTVEAFVNGRVVRTIRLEPGTYDVSDFPFVQGSNDVELVITDDAGRREVLSFSLFIDRTQLAKGLSEYGFYGGVQTDRGGDGVDYSSDYAVSGFYRRGLSDNFTLGGNLQYSDAASMAGAEMVWGSEWGTLGGDVAFSQLDASGSGWAVNVSYERLVQSENGGMSIVAGFEARSQGFGSLGQTAPNNPYVFNTSLGVNRSFGDQSFAGLQLRYAKGRDLREDESSVRLTYGRRLSETMNVVMDADYSAGGFADGASFRVALVRRFGVAGSARVEYDTLADRARLGYQTSGGQGVGAWSATANLEGGSEALGLNGSAAYAANRADLGLAHTTAYSADSNDISNQRTSLRAATAIAYAGGRFAVGRPISDGFVIVEPFAGARDVRIEVEPSPDSRYASSGPLGAALYGQVSAYSPRTVVFDAPEAPAGFDVGQGATRILPPYRAGYLVTVGSSYGMTAIGKLLDASGEPLALLSGVAIEQGGEGRRVTVFTNRQGAFGASGLKEGRWRIEMLGDPPVVYTLVVPASETGVVRVGDLRPEQ